MEERQALVVERILELHAVAAHVPMVLRQDVLQVHIVVAEAAFRVQHGGDHGQAARVAVVEDHEARLAVDAHGAQARAKVRRVRHHVVADLPVAGHAEVQQLVVLRVDAGRGAGEVQRVGLRLAAEVGDRDGDVLAQVLALPPDHPAGAADGFAVLVAARRD